MFFLELRYLFYSKQCTYTAHQDNEVSQQHTKTGTDVERRVRNKDRDRVARRLRKKNSDRGREKG